METKEKINSSKQFNKKLFLAYSAISLDLLFFYVISFLFLVNEKNLTPSEIVFADAFYPLFQFIFQIPSTILIEKIGKKNSLILGNFFIAVYTFLIIGTVNVTTLILANIFCSFGFALKEISEPNILYDSLDSSENKQEQFSKLNGKGYSNYFFIDSVSSLITGFLFTINSYLPLIISLLINILSIFLASLFKEIPSDTIQKAENNSISSYIKNLYSAFKFIFKSKRLQMLFLFHGVFAGFLYIMEDLRRSLLTEVGMPSEQFGLIFAILGIVGSISSNYSYKYHEHYRNRVLTFFSISFSLSVLFAGLSLILHLPKFLMYFTILTSFTIQYIIRTPYPTLIKQYLSSFSDSSMRLKITSASLFIEGTASALLSFLSSIILEYSSSYILVFFLGCIFTIILIFILELMKTKVGLKPEEYSPKDINFYETTTIK